MQVKASKGKLKREIKKTEDKPEAVGNKSRDMRRDTGDAEDTRSNRHTDKSEGKTGFKTWE